MHRQFGNVSIVGVSSFASSFGNVSIGVSCFGRCLQCFDRWCVVVWKCFDGLCVVFRSSFGNVSIVGVSCFGRRVEIFRSLVSRVSRGHLVMFRSLVCRVSVVVWKCFDRWCVVFRSSFRNVSSLVNVFRSSCGNVSNTKSGFNQLHTTIITRQSRSQQIL